MGRLELHDAPQHGPREGQSTTKPVAAKQPKRKASANTPPPAKKKKRTFLSKDEQALLIVKYLKLPKAKKGRGKDAAALDRLCREYDVCSNYPARLVKELEETEVLPDRDGVGGAPERITEEEEVLLISTLESHAYDLTYRQIETLTGISASTVWRYVKESAGWKEVRKGTRPLLSDANVTGRREWGEKHKTDEWELQIDLDEKIFTAYSATGTLKLPPGHDKPKTQLKSKRNVPKVMMLTGIGKPSRKHKFDGKVGIWEIGEVRPAKRGDSRTGLMKGDPVFDSANLDGEKWIGLLVDKVIPAIREKLPKASTVKIQFDNAPGHVTGRAVDERLQRAMNKAKPKIVIVLQIPQSPCTNLCDLGFFRSIDSRLPKLRSFKLPEFIQQIKGAYQDYPPEKIASLVEMKRRVVQCLIKYKGTNDFKLPHGKKKS